MEGFSNEPQAPEFAKFDAAETNTAHIPPLQTPSTAASSVGEDTGHMRRSRIEAPPYRRTDQFSPQIADPPWTLSVANTFLCATPAVSPVARALSAPARLARIKKTSAAQWPEPPAAE